MPAGARHGSILWGGLLVLAVSGVLASVSIPAPHTGGDNAGYLALAHSLAQGAGYTELWDPETPPHTKYPPVFPLLLAGLMLVGVTSWMGFKLLSAAAVSLAILLVFAWVSERRGPLTGAAVASLTLLSAGWLDASRWILSEPVFLAFTLLALWAAERGVGEIFLPRFASLGPGGRARGESAGAADAGSQGGAWIWVAGAAAIAAFLTRSAGAPLVVALLAALLFARRFQAAGIFAGALAVAAGWWTLRVRSGGGEGAYQSEFWMVNPYEPELGTVGWLDLPARGWTNLRLYVGEVLPGEWWMGEGGAVVLLGLVLAALAVWGWSLRLRRSYPGPAELFVPLYLGLILLWPPVWSGDRFLLPLLPLILLYAGEALWYAGRPLGSLGGPSLAAAGFLVLAVPAQPGWMGMAGQAAECRRVAAAGDVFRCHGDGFREFRDAAAWSGANLPPGAVVLNRKPRIHYLLGGPPGRTFPFTRDPELFLDEADQAGARYLLLDHVDMISMLYLPAVIQARPLAFCHLTAWGGGGGVPGTDLFGILPPGERGAGGDASGIGPCPADFRLHPEGEPATGGTRVPRLAP